MGCSRAGYSQGCSESSPRAGTGSTFNFAFNSPKALDPVEAAREAKKASQQIALGYVYGGSRMIDEIKITSLSGRGSLFLKKGEYWSYWLGPVDWGQVQGQHNTYAYFDQVGESIVSTTIRTRPLSITGWVIDGGTGDLQSRCDFLNAFISPVEDYTLDYKGKKINFRPDISVAYSPEYIKNNEKVRRFLIQATCPYPLFTDLDDTAVPFDQKKLFRFPNNFGQVSPVVFASIGKAYSVTVDNRGGFTAGMIVRIRFSGEVQNPRVKNLTTGKFIGMKRTFQRGEQLELSTVPGSKHMKLWGADGAEQNVIKYRDYRSSFDTQLIPGTNRLALDCDDLDQRANMDVTVYYTPLYLEVE